MKKFLAVCVFMALTGAVMAQSDGATTSFTGTVDVKFDWNNYGELLRSNGANCDDWSNWAVKYDAYLVLCYDPILCPVCPFDVYEAELWLVNKKTKYVFFASSDFGGIMNQVGFCFGNGNVGVMFDTWLPTRAFSSNFDATDITAPYVPVDATTQELTFVLSGMREKFNAKAPLVATNILNLTGGIAMSTVAAQNTTPTNIGQECDDLSEALFALVSFKKNNLKVTDKYCPECVDCLALVSKTWDQVYKSNKKSYWFTITGFNDVTVITDPSSLDNAGGDLNPQGL